MYDIIKFVLVQLFTEKIERPRGAAPHPAPAAPNPTHQSHQNETDATVRFSVVELVGVEPQAVGSIVVKTQDATRPVIIAQVCAPQPPVAAWPGAPAARGRKGSQVRKGLPLRGAGKGVRFGWGCCCTGQERQQLGQELPLRGAGKGVRLERGSRCAGLGRESG